MAWCGRCRHTASNASAATADSVGLQCEHAELVFGTYFPDAPASGASSTVRTLLTTVPEAPLIATSDYEPGGWLRGDYTTGEYVGGSPPLEAAAGGVSITGARVDFAVASPQCYWHDD